MRFILGLATAAAVTLGPAGAGATAPASFAAFATPSKSIVCKAQAGRLDCAVLSSAGSGRAPRIWTLTATKPVTSRRAKAPYAKAATKHVLRYGTSWRSGKLTCASWRRGLTCSSTAGAQHGFVLSKASSQIW